jgi:DNA-binding FadR family transcriptional regulator
VFYKGAYMMLAESLRKLVLEGQLGTVDIDEAYRALYGKLLRLACDRASAEEVDAIEAAVDEIEQHQGADALPRRIEATARFFSSISLAGHNEALRLMAQTMTSVLRERMTHVIPMRPRPDVFPLRRKVVQCLRARDAEGAVAALDDLITMLRKDASAQVDGGAVAVPVGH